MKKIVLLVLVLFFAACGSQKKIVETKTIVERDSVIVRKVQRIIQPIATTMTISKPCDSLGNLIPFYQKFESKGIAVVLSNKNGKINAEVNVDSIVSVRVEKYKQLMIHQSKVKETKIVRYRLPFWGWMSLILNVLLVLFIFKVLQFR